MYVQIMEVLAVGLLTIMFYLLRKRHLTYRDPNQKTYGGGGGGGESIEPPYVSNQGQGPVAKMNSILKCVGALTPDACSNVETYITKPKYKRDPDQEDIGYNPCEH